MTRPLSPECRLLFRSADPECPPGEIESLASAVRDWERLLALAEREAASVQVTRALEPAERVVPEAAMAHLRHGAAMRELRMQYLSHRLQRTVGVLAERGVPFLLLKGAAIGAMVDPTFCWRPMNDVDILVHRKDVPAAREAIIESGWPLTTDPRLLALLAEAHHLPPFVDPNVPGMRLELHVALLPAGHPFAIEEEDVWRSAQKADAPFAGALLPAPEHLLLHGAVHFAWQHVMQFPAWRTFRLLWAAQRAAGFDWDRFAEMARAARAATCCYWTLRLAEQLAGIAVPAGVMRDLSPPTVEWLRAAVERHFIADIALGEGAQSPSVQLSRWLWMAAVRPGWSGHQRVGSWDPENRWGRVFGTAAEESRLARVGRHVTGHRRWTSFLRETLLS